MGEQLGTDASVESRDDAMAAGVIVRCELLVEAPIGNTGTCDKDAAGMHADQDDCFERYHSINGWM